MLENLLLLILILLFMKYELLINEHQSVPATSYIPYGILKKLLKKSYKKRATKSESSAWVK